MAEWLIEYGIGETRAALIDDATMLAIRILPDDAGLQAGAVVRAQLVERHPQGHYGLARTETGDEILLETIGKAPTLGAALYVEITRAAIPEPGVVKRAKGRPAGTDHPILAPTLEAQLAATGWPVRTLHPDDADALEAAGWSEWLERAASGEVPFEGGALRVHLTPAMTLIDVDGYLPPAPLAEAAARAAAQAIHRFDMGGSIGIDFPTLANKAERLAVAAAFDAHAEPPFERTAINGFGFMQIIRPRVRPSVCELMRYDRVGARARALLRQAQRSHVIGAITLHAHPSVCHYLERRPDWCAALARRLGGTVTLRADATLGIAGGHVQVR